MISEWMLLNIYIWHHDTIYRKNGDIFRFLYLQNRVTEQLGTKCFTLYQALHWYSLPYDYTNLPVHKALTCYCL